MNTCKHLILWFASIEVNFCKHLHYSLTAVLCWTISTCLHICMFAYPLKVKLFMLLLKCHLVELQRVSFAKDLYMWAEIVDTWRPIKLLVFVYACSFLRLIVFFSNVLPLHQIWTIIPDTPCITNSFFWKLFLILYMEFSIILKWNIEADPILF